MVTRAKQGADSGQRVGTSRRFDFDESSLKERKKDLNDLAVWMSGLKATNLPLDDPHSLCSGRAFAELLHEIDKNFFDERWLKIRPIPRSRSHPAVKYIKRSHIRRLWLKMSDYILNVMNRRICGARWKQIGDRVNRLDEIEIPIAADLALAVAFIALVGPNQEKYIHYSKTQETKFPKEMTSVARMVETVKEEMPKGMNPAEKKKQQEERVLELKTKLKLFQSTVEKLTLENEKLTSTQKEFNLLKTHLDAAQADVKEWRAKANQYQSDAELVKKREKEVKELQGQVKSLTSRLEHHVKRATIDEDNKAGIVQLRTQIETLTVNNVELNDNVESKKRMLEALEPLKGEIITIKSKNGVLEKKNLVVTKQKEKLERQVAELNEKLADNQQILKTVCVEIERMREAETKAETKLTELEKLLELRTNERNNCEVLLSKCKQDRPYEEDKTQPIERSSKIEKKLVLKAVFDDVLSLSEIYRFSADEEHFGALWSFIILRKNDNLHLYLKCLVPGVEKYSVRCQRVFKLKAINGLSSFKKVSSTHSDYEPAFGSSIKWDLFKKHFVIDGKCHVEADIEINDVTGVYKKSYETFNETSFSDMVLVVQNKKFHVSKMFLASRSTYFRTLFEKCSPDSEIVINDVESEDFHVFLGVLYGDLLDESTVEIALLMAEHFDAEVVTRRCEDFLIKTSQMTLKKKLQMAVRYKLDNLAKICIDAI